MSTGPVGSGGPRVPLTSHSPPSEPGHVGEHAVDHEEGLLHKAHEVWEEGVAWGVQELPEIAKDAFHEGKELAARLKEHGFTDTVKHALGEGRKEVAHETAHHATKTWGPAKTVGQKIGAAFNAYEMVHDITKFGDRTAEVGHLAHTLKDDAVKLFKGEKVDMHQLGEAVYNGGLAAEELGEGALRGAKGVMTGQKLVNSYRAAATAFREAAPLASKAVTFAAAKAATKAVFQEAAPKAAASLVKAAATGAAKAAEGGMARAVIGTAGRAAAKATLEGASHAAAEAAVKATAKVATGALAKGAARFAPGLNVAMAVVDTAVAVATLADPKASTGAKVTSCITAAGSILAATNIPVVSQIGAGVSIVSGFIGGFFR